MITPSSEAVTIISRVMYGAFVRVAGLLLISTEYAFPLRHERASNVAIRANRSVAFLAHHADIQHQGQLLFWPIALIFSTIT
jgi:hypothetical protein